ncbi:hypothetical protein HDU97_008700 [Phlyctochytrium planicorne]|nr:hypothetical protein HDU97_008700 [Phlyctochytrium planicorne]
MHDRDILPAVPKVQAPTKAQQSFSGAGAGFRASQDTGTQNSRFLASPPPSGESTPAGSAALSQQSDEAFAATSIAEVGYFEAQDARGRRRNRFPTPSTPTRIPSNCAETSVDIIQPTSVILEGTINHKGRRAISADNRRAEHDPAFFERSVVIARQSQDLEEAEQKEEVDTWFDSMPTTNSFSEYNTLGGNGSMLSRDRSVAEEAIPQLQPALLGGSSFSNLESYGMYHEAQMQDTAGGYWIPQQGYYVPAASSFYPCGFVGENVPDHDATGQEAHEAHDVTLAPSDHETVEDEAESHEFEFRPDTSEEFIPVSSMQSANFEQAQEPAPDELEVTGELDERKGLPQACLFVASLSSARTDEQLFKSVSEHVVKWGSLANVKVLKDWMGRPYAFVQFENINDAKRALVEAHNTVVDNRHIRVEQARVNRTLFIAKFNRTAAENVRDVLEEYGPVEDLTLLQNYQTGKSKGCGFVKYCFREDAIKAFLGLRQSRWVVEWATNLDRDNIEVDLRSIFVGQLNQTMITPDLLQERFGAYGEIESLQLVNKYPFDTRPAFAFIKYVDEASAEKAVVDENAKQWLDRTIRVQYRETGDIRATTGLARPSGSEAGSSTPGIHQAKQHHAVSQGINSPQAPPANSSAVSNRGGQFGKSHFGGSGYEFGRRRAMTYPAEYAPMGTIPMEYHPAFVPIDPYFMYQRPPMMSRVPHPSGSNDPSTPVHQTPPFQPIGGAGPGQFVYPRMYAPMWTSAPLIPTGPSPLSVSGPAKSGQQQDQGGSGQPSQTSSLAPMYPQPGSPPQVGPAGPVGNIGYIRFPSVPGPAPPTGPSMAAIPLPHAPMYQGPTRSMLHPLPLAPHLSRRPPAPHMQSHARQGLRSHAAPSPAAQAQPSDDT